VALAQGPQRSVDELAAESPVAALHHHVQHVLVGGRNRSMVRSRALARTLFGEISNDDFPLRDNEITLLGSVWAGGGWRR
jgi:hypothetical protein